MENKKQEKNGIKYYLKKYSYYIILAGLILVLSTAIILTSVFASKDLNKDKDVNTGVITFQLPVSNGSVLMGYSKEHQYFSELNVWKTHKAIDFSATIGAEVLASYDGTVTKIYNNLLEGTVIEIDHGNNLKTHYGSLDKDVKVKLNDVVKTGTVIGKASATATGETVETGEVHFEVWKDGNRVDPAGYLNISGDK